MCVCTYIKLYSSVLNVHIYDIQSTASQIQQIQIYSRTYIHTFTCMNLHTLLYVWAGAYDSVYVWNRANNTQTHAHNKSIKTHTPRYWISQNGHATFAAVGLINNNVFISASRDSRTTQDGTWGSRGFGQQGSR